MKKALIRFLQLAGTLLLLAGCGPIFGPPPELEPTATPALVELVTGQPLELAAVLAGVGKWSPSGNEILLAEANDPSAGLLQLAAAPLFEPLPLVEPGPVSSFAWTPEGQRVVYSSAQGQTGAVKIWLANKDGTDLRAVQSFDGILSSRFLGWPGPQELAYANELGGGFIEVGVLDITRAQKQPWGATLFGRAYPPQDGYIPGLSGSLYFDVIMASSRFPHQPTFDHRNTLGNVLPIPDFQPLDPPYTASTRFLSWRGQSSQALVLWSMVVFREEPVLAQHLLLWDVEQNELSLAAAHGKGGLFSPDGSRLAYLTQGPLRLDEVPRPPELPPQEPLDDADYLHLLDMHSGQVLISFAGALHRQAEDDPTVQQLEAAFSSGARYLAFLTRGQGLPTPVGVQAAQIPDGSPVYLNIIDLQARALVYVAPASRSSGLSWSPSGSRLVFQDPQEQWLLFDLDRQEIRPVTLTGGRLGDWSYNGSYLSLEARDGSAEGPRSYLFEVGEGQEPLGALDIPLQRIYNNLP